MSFAFRYRGKGACERRHRFIENHLEHAEKHFFSRELSHPFESSSIDHFSFDVTAFKDEFKKAAGPAPKKTSKK